MLAAVGAAAALTLGPATAPAAADDPCAAPIANPIPCENSKPGNPPTEWDVTGSGDASIQGFATDISINRGGTVRFKIRTTASAYRIDVYRLGYYGGQGARKVATLSPSASLPQNQPACLHQSSTGLVDCGNWAESASWQVPADAVSGVYVARPVRLDTQGASHIVFVVRDDTGGSDLLFQTSDATWHAYNEYGGASLYTGNGPATDTPSGRAYKVSYNRPFETRGEGDPESWLFDSEYPMLRWLEANGYDVSYSTDLDSARHGHELLEHEAFLSVGHDEYWSDDHRANVEAARDAGVNLAFFSGNEVYWKTRWEPAIDGTGTAFRTLVCYKEDTAKLDPSPTWTGRWADPTFSPPSDGGRPQNALTGTQFGAQFVHDPMSIPYEFAAFRMWRNTSVANLTPGQVAVTAPGILGYEWDLDLDNGFRPNGLIHLAESRIPNSSWFEEGIGQVFGLGIHNLTLYRAPSGALVFGAGTVRWSWGLDNHHAATSPITDAGEPPAPDPRLQQATANLLVELGAAPATPLPGLVAPIASGDSTGPTVTITSPAAGSTFPSSGTVTISGTASDAAGTTAMVEVSGDDGRTWRRATGRSNWTYAWSPANGPTGSLTLKARAIDDFANIGATAGAAVTVLPRAGLVGAYAFNEGSGTAVSDSSGAGNDGTISGATRTSSGHYDAALSFDGVDDWVTIPNSASLNPAAGITLEAWVKPSVVNDWRTTILKETSSGLAYALYANTTDDVPAAYVGDRVDGRTILPSDQWTHLAAAYDRTSIRLYVNGEHVGTQSNTAAVPASTGPLRFGGNAVWNEFFQGVIDEVRIYNRGLSAAEVLGDMLSSISNSPPPPDTTPPTVSVTAPAGGATVRGTVNLNASASDDVGVTGVQFKIDGANLGAEDTTAPYSTPWDTSSLGDGTHTVTAVARDAAGNQQTSAGVDVTVDNVDTSPPDVSVTAPAAGATVRGTINLTATAADDVGVAGVQFKIDGANVGLEDTAAPYGVPWDSSAVADGTYTVTAVARDAAGNQRTSAGVDVTVDNVDTNAPTVSITAPVDGANVAGLVTVSATAADDIGVAGVQFVVDGGALGAEDTSAPYELSWNSATVPDGAHTLTAIARDAAGNLTTSAEVRLTVENDDTTSPSDPPALRQAAATHTSFSVAWDPSTDNVGVARYDLFVDGEAAGSTVLTSATFDRPCGTSHEVGVEAVDLANNRSGRSLVTAATLECDTTPPSVAITAPADGATVSGTLPVNASASDGVGVAGVQFKLDGATLGVEDTTAPYGITWNTAAVANGSHVLTAVARDGSGNQATSSDVRVTVNNTATPGLVAAYAFNEGTGTTVGDASGAGNIGTAANASWSAAGKYGGALSFNGNSSWVTVPDAASLDLTTHMTLEAWVRPTVLTSWRTILLKEFGGTFAYALYANTSSNRARAYVNGDGVNSSTKLPLNVWSHVAATWDGSSLRIYVDAANVRTFSVGGSMPNSPGPLRIGGNPIWNEWFQGLIDDVRVYNRALPLTEIQRDMTTPVS